MYVEFNGEIADSKDIKEIIEKIVTLSPAYLYVSQ